MAEAETPLAIRLSGGRGAPLPARVRNCLSQPAPRGRRGRGPHQARRGAERRAARQGGYSA